MNMAERAEDIDYEPDVLKFKQIWNEMKQTTKPKQGKAEGQAGSENQSKGPKKTKDQKKRDSSKEQKKQIVMSQKNVVRNPKLNPEKVVEVVTSPQGYYQDSLRNQKNNVDKQALIQNVASSTNISQLVSLRKALSQKDYELSLLRVSNSRNEDRIRSLEQQVEDRERRISELEARERELISKNNAFSDSEKMFDYGKVEYQNFRNDTRRLLKMLQSTAEYQQFANLGLDDNGVRFLNEVNKKIKSSLDSKERTVLHFCTCNKQFVPESGFWVPEKAYNFGKEFIKQRKGELTQAELELLLYDLNKIWREREKRIVNTMTSLRTKQVEQLKRKLALQKSGTAKTTA